jgi:DNA-damage-inducible protein J
MKESPMTAAVDSVVRARIDTATKKRAAAALGAMGLSISDAIRLLMVRIAEEQRFPFEVKVPNRATRQAMAELEAGKGKRFKSAKALFKDLGV